MTLTGAYGLAAGPFKVRRAIYAGLRPIPSFAREGLALPMLRHRARIGVTASPQHGRLSLANAYLAR